MTQNNDLVGCDSPLCRLWHEIFAVWLACSPELLPVVCPGVWIALHLRTFRTLVLSLILSLLILVFCQFPIRVHSIQCVFVVVTQLLQARICVCHYFIRNVCICAVLLGPGEALHCSGRTAFFTVALAQQIPQVRILVLCIQLMIQHGFAILRVIDFEQQFAQLHSGMQRWKMVMILFSIFLHVQLQIHTLPQSLLGFFWLVLTDPQAA
mmetsp:Transcript_10293/g.15808  ORF Transcript_10293/g.15808 Transcript_10293/m.15808 type:complete len:209 (+) Transcript_10293:227-853(+)